MNKKVTLAVLFPFVVIFLIIMNCSDGPPSGKLNYPETRTVDVVDTINGTLVADPYRWLEYNDSADVVEWSDAQMKLAKWYIDQIPAKEKIAARLADLWDYPTQGIPYKTTNRYFISKNMGLQEHSVLYTMKTLDEEPVVALDPNTWSEDASKAMSNYEPSEDGAYIAYAVTAHGAEVGTIHIKNIITGEILRDTIPNVRRPGIVWLKDNSGFYYNRHPKPGSVPAGDESYYDFIYFHKLGDPYTADKLIYKHDDIKEISYGVNISTDDRYLILSDWIGHSDELRFIDLQKGGEPQEIVTGFKGIYYGFAIGSTYYIMTNEDAPNYKIMAIDLRNPKREFWKEVVPEAGDLLESFAIVNNMIIAQYLHNAHSQLKVLSLHGVPIHEIELPTMGTVSGISGRWDDNEMFVGFSSFTYPTTQYKYDFENNTLSEYYRFPVKVNTEGYETKQVWYESKDGTRVSMFIVHKAGLKMNGKNPTYLTGYGGFTSNQVPYFSSTRFVLMENGFVFALPNLRGGAEYGEKWHRAAMQENKQNTFDDFIAAAEYLIDQGYTSPEHLAIEGGSNGGLLTGACAVQRPDLFRTVYIGAPLLDMVRYHKFLMARYWIPEYGDPDNPEHLPFMLNWSPYHNVKDNVAYPSMLITASETDPRVHPMHARKFGAAIQAANTSDNPILIMVDRDKGHGWDLSTSKTLEDLSYRYAFLFWQLGVKVSVGGE